MTLAVVCDDVDELRELIERWRAEGVEVSREDVTEAIARHQRVQDLQRADDRQTRKQG